MKNNLKNNIIGFITKCQVNSVEFRISQHCDNSIFASCFALFILHLFGETKTFEKERIRTWIDYINSFQDEKTGYYFIHNDYEEISEKSRDQLTTFCLSALEILNASPKYELQFMSKFNTTEYIERYLAEKGCLKGVPGSGNFAMFLAIFLFYKNKHRKDKGLNTLIQYWFDAHNRKQNPKTGFWGNKILERHYWGFQNALHQFMVYNYANEPICFPDQIADKIISMQDYNGFFSMYPGGGGCWDFDAAHTLIAIKPENKKLDLRIIDSLKKLRTVLLGSVNIDGGFCETRLLNNNWRDYPSFIKFVFYSKNPYIAYSKLKTTFPLLRNNVIPNHWSKANYKVNDSDLWNTFLKCLTIAEIETYLLHKDIMQFNEIEVSWEFQKFIGFGYLSLD